MKIENDFLSVSASTQGGELTSVRFLSKEQLYQKQGHWPYSDHILFPLVGNGSPYTCNGVLHSSSRHGFARDSLFVEKPISQSAMSFTLKDNEQTQSIYPYSFCFEETFALEKNILIRRFRVQNEGEVPLPFVTGSHPAFSVVFGKAWLLLPQPLSYYPDLYHGMETKPYPLGGEQILTKDFLLGMDTLVIPNPGTPIVLENGLGTRMEFHYASPYLALWTPANEGDDFLCVEPWYGLPKAEKDPLELSLRFGFELLPPQESKTFEDRILFEKEK